MCIGITRWLQAMFSFEDNNNEIGGSHGCLKASEMRMGLLLRVQAEVPELEAVWSAALAEVVSSLERTEALLFLRAFLN